MTLEATTPAYEVQQELFVQDTGAAPSQVQLQAYQALMQAIAEPLLREEERIRKAAGTLSITSIGGMSDSWHSRLALEQHFLNTVVQAYLKLAEAAHKADATTWNAFVQRPLNHIPNVVAAFLDDLDRAVRQEDVPAGPVPAYVAAAQDLGLTPPAIGAASQKPPPPQESNVSGGLVAASIGAGILGSIWWLGRRRYR